MWVVKVGPELVVFLKLILIAAGNNDLVDLSYVSSDSHAARRARRKISIPSIPSYKAA